MRIASVVLFGFSLCLLCSGCKEKKDSDVPDVPLKYSDQFYSNTRDILVGYDSLTEVFIRWDSNSIKSKEIFLKDMIEGFSGGDRNMDTALLQSALKKFGFVKNDLKQLIDANSLEAKRRKYQAFSNHLYDYLKNIGYDGQAVYYQECPMAFNDVEVAQWLSAKPQIRNPYLGLHHPKYGKGMLVCGDTKDSLNYRGVNKK